MIVTALMRRRKLNKVSISKRDLRARDVEEHIKLFAFYQASKLELLGKAFREASAEDLQELKEIIPEEVVEALKQRLTLNPQEYELFLHSFSNALYLYVKSMKATASDLRWRLRFKDARDFERIIGDTQVSQKDISQALNAIKASQN